MAYRYNFESFKIGKLYKSCCDKILCFLLKIFTNSNNRQEIILKKNNYLDF